MSTTRIPREIDASSAAASKEEIIRPLALLELEFDSGTVRFNSSEMTVKWDDKDWVGVGQTGKISSVRESTGLESFGLTVSITGIDPSYISLSLGDNIQGRNANLYMALFDEDGHLIKDPIKLGPWKMDTMSIEIGAMAEIVVQCESRMAIWNRPKIKRYTHEEQIARYPGDLGLEYMAKLVNLDFNWGESDKEIPAGMWEGVPLI